MEFKDELIRSLEGEELWTVITFKTPHGPGKTLEKLVEALEDAGWRITFKANWWTADIPYGLVRIDAKKDGKEKIVLGKWILGGKCELIRIENMDLIKGRDEFFRMVDSITSTLIHDPVIRTMREQY
ncbi:ribonucleoside-triphosphate reductase [Thermococcus sp. LS1]|uniref:ribonucleoside-triphosphate reductase n=1 Tax=Thermococcus sp. LS1 TaxID=1638259 RepID=UPI001439FC1A|nr:ribonucleoside-triphosphate reductase [Thermococcus sp. LS1]NJD99022.1 ribonucleoside-triphosphate reductase [Thermococcus sp. LS1]